MVCEQREEARARTSVSATSLDVIPFVNRGRIEATVPGSKSLSNRALLLASILRGGIRVEGLLFSDDTEIAINCLRDLGVEVVVDVPSASCEVRGTGEFSVESAELFVGNAGTVARFLPAMLALAGCGTFRIDGTEEMRRRPIKGLIRALRGLGVSVRWLGEAGFFPLELVTGGAVADVWEVDASKSSQILSALLMAAPLAGKVIRVRLLGDTVSWPFVQMTLRMMGDFGAVYEVSPDQREFLIERTGYRAPGAGGYRVEPDATAASYFLALPIAVGGSVFVSGIVHDGLQGDVAFADVLEQIGFGVERAAGGGMLSRWDGADWRGSRDKGVLRVFDFNAISDTFLTLAGIAPLLPHPIRIEGIAHTRAQESDRVEAMATGLRLLGQKVRTGPDAIEIQPDLSALRSAALAGVSIPTWRDHRVAMSFAILGCADVCGDGRRWMIIEDPGCVAKTFPDFFSRLDHLRMGGGG